MRLLSLFVIAITLFAGDDPPVNALSAEERAAGWKLLFDGKSFNGWNDVTALKPPGDGWSVQNGCLVANKQARIVEDLFTTERFQDFRFSFEYKLEPGGNSGIKYRVLDTAFFVNARRDFENGLERAARTDLRPDQFGLTYTVALEMQLIDDALHPDARRGAERQTGALYAFIPAAQPARAPADQWHRGLLVVRGSHVEHWINGLRLVDADVAAPQVVERIRQRYRRLRENVEADAPVWKRPTPIVLQNHGDSTVWFRNLKVQELR